MVSTGINTGGGGGGHPGISLPPPPAFTSSPKLLTPCVVNDVCTDIKDSSVIHSTNITCTVLTVFFFL